MDTSDMDIDFLTSEDAIEKFLNGKLRLVEARNQELTEQLDRRRSILEQTLKKSASEGPKAAPIVEATWKRLVNNTYVIGLEIGNVSDRKIGNIEVVLSWNSKDPLNYTFNWRKGDDGKQAVLLTIPSPSFTKTLSHQIDGVLTYHEDRAPQTSLPPITLEASDATNSAIIVKKTNISDGDPKSLLAAMVAGEETKLFAHHTTAIGRNVEELLEFDCLFGKISENLFNAGAASECFDGAILATRNGKYVNIYSRNEEQMLGVLHHVYRSVSGVLFLPVCLEDEFQTAVPLRDAREVQEKTEELKESLGKEVDLIRNFLREHSSVRGDSEALKSYRKFLLDLTDQEQRSDALCCVLKNCSDADEMDNALDISM